MKKMIFLILAGTLFTSSQVLGFDGAQQFLEDVNDDIFRGIQSGDLTRNEVKQLTNDIRAYQLTVWEADFNGRLTRNERRQIESMERRLIDKLDNFLYNRNRANNRFNQPRLRNGRTTARTQPRRGRVPIICPPPRRNW